MARIGTKKRNPGRGREVKVPRGSRRDREVKGTKKKELWNTPRGEDDNGDWDGGWGSGGSKKDLRGTTNEKKRIEQEE